MWNRPPKSTSIPTRAPLPRNPGQVVAASSRSGRAKWGSFLARSTQKSRSSSVESTRSTRNSWHKIIPPASQSLAVPAGVQLLKNSAFRAPHLVPGDGGGPRPRLGRQHRASRRLEQDARHPRHRRVASGPAVRLPPDGVAQPRRSRAVRRRRALGRQVRDLQH